MATLNERINSMMSRLEAAAESLDDTDQSSSGSTAQSSRYSYQPPKQAEPEPESGPGSFARSIDAAKRKEKMRKRSQTGQASLSGGLVPPASPQSMLQGVIYAEILGRPVARRRGRGRRGF